MDKKPIINAILMTLILVVLLSKEIKPSLKIITFDPRTEEEYTDLVRFYEQSHVKVGSAYNVRVLDTEGRNEIIFDRTVIFGALYVPRNVQRVVLRNTIISGGIKFENDEAEVSKEGYVIVGPVEVGIIQSGIRD